MTPRRLATLMAALVLTGVVLTALIISIVLGPSWMVGDGAGLTVAERLKAQNDVRSTLLQAFGGFLALGGVTLGAAMTLRQVRAKRDGHSIELFTKAIDMLASKEVSVRHGGVYALEQLAELDERYHGHAHALLTAFLRRHAPLMDGETEKHGGIPDDIGGALAALSRQTAVFGGWSELERIDLRGTELNKLNLSRTCFAHADLEGASLVETTLVGASLTDVNLRGTDLTRTDLRGAELTNSDLTGAHLEETVLLGADLTGARLHDVTLRAVVADHTTTWPKGFSPPFGSIRRRVKPRSFTFRTHTTHYRHQR